MYLLEVIIGDHYHTIGVRVSILIYQDSVLESTCNKQDDKRETFSGSTM